MSNIKFNEPIYGPQNLPIILGVNYEFWLLTWVVDIFNSNRMNMSNWNENILYIYLIIFSTFLILTWFVFNANF